MSPIKLLVSPTSAAEAVQAIAGGADIIDCKNPDEGSLGAAMPGTIIATREAITASGKRCVLLSATLGDLADKPGTAALAATGLVSLGADYIKAGVHGPRTPERAAKLLDAIVKAVTLIHACTNKNVQIVAAGYADHARAAASIPPMDLVKVAASTGCNVVMVDTAIKDGKGLLDFMSRDEVIRFCDAAKQSGMQVALAGNLREKDISFLKTTGVDIIGVRSMVVRGGDRVTGTIDATLVALLKRMLA
jgi:uncharacterized protein (UPF0264 family)